ncbi:MAG: phosphatase PAP2 family protein [Ilumatobacteraceae bacterium]
MWLSWQISIRVAIVLGAVWLASRRGTRPWQRQITPLSKEAGLLFAMYAAWIRLGETTVMGTGSAYDRARWVWHAERWMHLPNEVTLQRLALHATWLIRFMNAYYIVFHVVPLGVFLVWMYVRHRESFAYWRNQLAFVSLACQGLLLIPVAPPRFFPELGFVDTAARYGPTVYHAGGFGDAGQLAAMPSMHVAWAMIIGIGTVSVSRSRWRWIGAVHAVIMVLAVTLTAYHWLLDGIVSTSILLIGIAIGSVWNRHRQLRRTGPPDQPPELEDPLLDRRLIGAEPVARRQGYTQHAPVNP